MNCKYREYEKIFTEIEALKNGSLDSALMQINEMVLSDKYVSDVCFRVLVHCHKSNILCRMKKNRLALDEAIFALSMNLSEEESWQKLFCYNAIGDVYASYQLLNLSNDMYLSALSFDEIDENCNFSAYFYFKIGQNYAKFADHLMAEAYYIRALQSLESVCKCSLTTNLESYLFGHLILALAANRNNTKIHYYLEKIEQKPSEDNAYQALLYQAKLVYLASVDDQQIHDIYTSGSRWFIEANDAEKYLDFAFAYYDYLNQRAYSADLIIEGVEGCLAYFEDSDAHIYPAYGRLLRILIKCQSRRANKKQAIITARKYSAIRKKRAKSVNRSSNEILAILKLNFVKRGEHALLKTKNEAIESNKQALASASRRLALLNDIGKRIIYNCDFNIIVDLIINNLNEQIKIDFAMIGVLNDAGDKLDVLSCKVFEDYLSLAAIELTDEASNLMQCIKTKQIIYVDDNRNKTLLKYKKDNKLAYLELQLNTLLYCPVIYKDKIIGVYALKSVVAGAYNYADFRLIKELAIFLAIAFADVKRTRKLNVELEQAEQLSNQLKLKKQQHEHAKMRGGVIESVLKKGLLDE